MLTTKTKYKIASSECECDKYHGKLDSFKSCQGNFNKQSLPNCEATHQTLQQIDLLSISKKNKKSNFYTENKKVEETLETLIEKN